MKLWHKIPYQYMYKFAWCQHPRSLTQNANANLQKQFLQIILVPIHDLCGFWILQRCTIVPHIKHLSMMVLNSELKALHITVAEIEKKC